MPAINPAPPQVMGLAAYDATALALIDASLLPLGTPVYVATQGRRFLLSVSSAATSADVVAVAGNNALRWLAVPSGPTSDFQMDLINGSGNPVPGAVGVASALSVKTANAETARTVYTFVLNGTLVTGITLDGNGITSPAGATTPGYAFASPSAGGIPGFGYDDNLPALLLYVNNRHHFLYANAFIMDIGAQASGGFFMDTSLAGGLGMSGSGATISLRSTTIDGVLATIDGGALQGRIVNSAAAVAAARCVTTNSSGLGIVADATTPTTCLGVSVAGAAGNGNLLFIRRGLAPGVISAATPGTRYYLGTAGALTTTRNVTSTQAQIQVGIARSATDLEVEISDRGINP